jgi:photosystem II stability/assembly factor-like uncharacterized protein
MNWAYSSDDLNWETTSASFLAHAASFGANMFIGLGENGSIYASPDRKVWTPQVSGTTQFLKDIIWHDGLFVAVGAYGIILTSPDGKNWTNRTGILNTSHYVNMSCVASSGSSWVVLGERTILRSVDLSAWNCIIDSSGGGFCAIVWNGERFIAAGRYSYWTTQPMFQIFMFSSANSPDGVVWSGQSTANSFLPKAVAWADTQFIAVGESGIATSSNGINWRLPSPSGLKLYDIAIGPYNGVSRAAVAVGDSGAIRVSSDGGVNWNSCVSRTTAPLNAICHGDSGYVAIKEGHSPLMSRDGVLWTAAQSITVNYLNDIAWGAGTYVAVGNAGAIVTSPDALRWTLRSSGTTQNLKSVIWSSGYFVTVGDSGTILSSPAPTPVQRPAQTRESGSYLTLNGSLVTYASGTPGPVRLALYNLQGRCIEVLDSKYRSSGAHRIVLPNTLPNGTYILSLRAGTVKIDEKVLFFR